MYKIIRFYKEDGFPGPARETIKTGLTLEEAQEHCQRDDTREEGVWFDGYTEEWMDTLFLITIGVYVLVFLLSGRV